MTTAPQNGPGSAAYRPDIDGLRAIAILSVVVFHAGFSGLPGGFVGVDVFFAISGYLIGGHIFSEARVGGFTFASFYERRVRRILPALIGLLVVMAMVGAFVLTPEEYREFGKESAATIIGGSNALFYSGGGYFAPAAEQNPLLMTWSLGVEEQFYLLFPIVMLALLRLHRRTVLPALLLLCAVSFAGSLLLIDLDPKAAFYLLPTRAWELGLGAALAVWERGGDPRRAIGRALAEPMALIGIALLAAAMLLYRSDIAFPGVYVLLPTIGTVLLIATPNATVNRWLLSLPPVTFMGRVSYSWYLWHWPLLYFNRLLGAPLGDASPAAMVIGSFVLGVISWAVIEQRFRRRVLSRRGLAWRYAVIVLAVAGAGVLLYKAGGFPQRLTPAARGLAERARIAREDACLAPYGADAPRAMATCVPPLAAGQSDRVVILGDSHASAIAPGIARLAREQGSSFGEMTKSSCLPLWDFARPIADRPQHWGECIAFQQRAFGYVRDHPEIGTVVLAGFWSDNPVVQAARAGSRPSQTLPLRPALAATIARLEALGKRVILVQDVPAFAFDPYTRIVGQALPARVVLAAADAAPGRVSAGADAVLPDTARPMIAAMAGNRRMLIDPVGALCRDGRCRYRDQTDLYYFDFQHLTAAGADAALRDVRLTRSGATAPVEKR